MGYGGYASPSGAGSDYGYLGGGFYVPAPYVAPKPAPKPKPKASTVKPAPGGANYGRPVYHNPKSSASNSSNWKPKPATTPIPGGVQYGQPVYHNPKAIINQPVSWHSPSPAQRQATAIANGVQIAGVNAPKINPKAAATQAVHNVAGRASSATSSGGGGGGGGGAGGAGASAAVAPHVALASVDTTPAVTAPVTPPAPTTRDVVIPDWTLDPTYQTQMAAYKKQAEDASTSDTSAKNQYDTSYNSTLKNIGWDPASNSWSGNDPGTQYGSAYRSNLEDYTGRGLGYSTDYYNDIGNINNVFNRQVGQLGQARDQFRQGQDTALNSYLGQNTLDRTQAGIDAATRVAANLGIDPSLVPKAGGTKTVTVPLSA